MVENALTLSEKAYFKLLKLKFKPFLVTKSQKPPILGTLSLFSIESILC